MRAYWANTSLNLEPENKDETSALELLLKIFRSGMNPGTHQEGRPTVCRLSPDEPWFKGPLHPPAD